MIQPENARAQASPKPLTMLWLVSLVLAVVVSDFMLGIARGSAFVDAVIFSIAAFWGARVALQTGLPLWYRRPARLWDRVFVFTIGLGVVGLNTYFTGWLTVKLGLMLPDYIMRIASTPLRGAVMSLRAGITEEILFRLLLGGLVMRAIGAVMPGARGWTKWLGIIVTGFGFFLLLHRNVLGFVCGTALAYIYFEAGLVPAMVVHFIADVIPWGLMIPLMRR